MTLGLRAFARIAEALGPYEGPDSSQESAVFVAAWARIGSSETCIPRNLTRRRSNDRRPPDSGILSRIEWKPGDREMPRTDLTLCLSLLTAVVCLSACSSPLRSHVAQDRAPLDSATNAYRAYGAGDCAAVDARFDETDLENWPPNEARSSFLLLASFCAERNDDISRARETYRQLLRESPLSFAADDARDRLRILRLQENDPEYGDWVAAAKARAVQGSTDRAPIERTPASYPPLAHLAQVGGYAVVEFGVTPRGDTDAPVVVDSEPPLLFDGVAVRAIREWRYAADADGTQSKRQAIRLVFKPDDAATPDLDVLGETSTN